MKIAVCVCARACICSCMCVFGRGGRWRLYFTGAFKMTHFAFGPLLFTDKVRWKHCFRVIIGRNLMYPCALTKMLNFTYHIPLAKARFQIIGILMIIV